MNLPLRISRRREGVEAALDAREDAWDRAFWEACATDKPTPPCPDDVRQWIRIKDRRAAIDAVWKHLWHGKRRDDEWTRWRAIQATVAAYLGRFWGDVDAERWRDRHPLVDARGKLRRPMYVPSWTLCYWNAHSDGYGYSHDMLVLHPGLRITMDHDGESFL